MSDPLPFNPRWPLLECPRCKHPLPPEAFDAPGGRTSPRIRCECGYAFRHVPLRCDLCHAEKSGDQLAGSAAWFFTGETWGHRCSVGSDRPSSQIGIGEPVPAPPPATCTCDLRVRQWDLVSGRCLTCGLSYADPVREALVRPPAAETRGAVPASEDASPSLQTVLAPAGAFGICVLPYRGASDEEALQLTEKVAAGTTGRDIRYEYRTAAGGRQMLLSVVDRGSRQTFIVETEALIRAWVQAITGVPHGK